MSTTTSTSATSSTASTPSAATNSLSTLANNFQDFLTLLMTQLQNQDPTSPLDTNQFTQQLVQFTQVEQQIDTNGSLTQLIQLTQGNAVIQGSSLVGKTVDVTSDKLSLQNGSAGLQFGSGAPASVNVKIANAAGTVVRNATVDTTANDGTWTWDGKSDSGATLADGAYGVTAVDASGGSGVVSFGVVAKATGLVKSGTDLKLELGALSTAFSAIQSVSSN